MQFIPARGRKRIGRLYVCRPNFRLQFIPARGRKPVAVLGICGARPCRCNSSPRGDGNKKYYRHLQRILVAIHPREGTETELVASKSSRYLCCNSSPRGDGNDPLKWNLKIAEFVAIHPREGTETFGAHPFPMTHTLQFIPARGRKPATSRPSGPCFAVAIHPREGTETAAFPCLFCQIVKLQFIPARGRKPVHTRKRDGKE